MIHPALFIGLGKYGSEISKSIYNYLKESDKNLFNIVHHLSLDENGNIDSENIDSEKYDFTGLKFEMIVENYRHNYQYILQKEDDFNTILSNIINNISQRKLIASLENKGYKVGTTIRVYIFSTLFDPVGSSAIIPILSFIQSLQETKKLQVFGLETNMIGFFPDSFESEPDESDDLIEQYYKRCYACLQELDYISDNPNEDNLFDNIYLFNSKNEAAVKVGNYQELSIMLSEILIALLNGSIEIDVAIEPLLIRKDHNKTTRYCSFGLNKLHFPVENVMKGISDYMCFNILESSAIQIEKKYPKHAVLQEVKNFMIENNYEKIDQDLSVDKLGNTIWVDFRYSGSIKKHTHLDAFINNLNKQIVDFEKTKLIEMNRKFSPRLDEIFSNMQTNLIEKIKSYIDNKSKEVSYSMAFMDMLIGQKSNLVSGGVTEETESLVQIEYKIKDFFDDDIKKQRDELENLGTEIKLKIIELESKNTAGKNSSARNFLDEVTNEVSPLANKLENNESDLNNGIETSDEIQTKDGSDSMTNTDELEEVNTDNIKSLSENIDKLKKKYEKLELKVKMYYEQICFSDFRMQFLDKKIKKNNSEKSNIIKNFEENKEDIIKTNELLVSLNSGKKDFIQKNLIIIPAVIFFFSFLLMYGITYISSISFFKIFIKATPALFTVLIIYGLIQFLKLKSGILRNITTTLSKLVSLEKLKVNLLLSFQDIENNGLKTKYYFNLFGNLLDSFIHHKNYIKNLRNQLDNFINKLNEAFSQKKSNWENLEFPSTLFVQSIMTKKGIQGFITKQNLKVNLCITEFFTEKNIPLSGYFTDFRDSENLDKFYDNISLKTEEMFSDIREKSVEDILKEENTDAMNPDNYAKVDNKIQNYFESAKSNILLEVEEGLDKSQTFSYFGVLNPEKSFVKKRLFHIFGDNVLPYITENKNEIVFTKFKIGFPAFYILSVRHGKSNLDTSEDKDSFYLNPEEWKTMSVICMMNSLSSR